MSRDKKEKNLAAATRYYVKLKGGKAVAAQYKFTGRGQKRIFL